MPATKTVKVPTYDINDNLEFTVQEIVSMKTLGASFEVSMNQSQDGLVFTWTNILSNPSGSIETAKLQLVNQFDSNGTTMTSSFSGPNTVNRVELATEIKNALKNNFAPISTNNTDSQTVLTDANVLDAGPIKLHKVSSTGKYTDLVDWNEDVVQIGNVAQNYIKFNNAVISGTYQIFLVTGNAIRDCGTCDLDISRVSSVESSLDAHSQIMYIPNKEPFKFIISVDPTIGGMTVSPVKITTTFNIDNSDYPDSVPTDYYRYYKKDHPCIIKTTEQSVKFSELFTDVSDYIIIRRVVKL